MVWPLPTSATRTRLVPIVAGAAGCALVLSACVGADTTDSTDDENAVTIVLPQEPPTLEACDSTLTSVGTVTRSNITEPLLERDPTTGDLLPLLATEWEATGDTEWTFTLREAATFSDG